MTVDANYARCWDKRYGTTAIVHKPKENEHFVNAVWGPQFLTAGCWHAMEPSGCWRKVGDDATFQAEFIELSDEEFGPLNRAIATLVLRRENQDDTVTHAMIEAARQKYGYLGTDKQKS